MPMLSDLYSGSYWLAQDQPTDETQGCNLNLASVSQYRSTQRRFETRPACHPTGKHPLVIWPWMWWLWGGAVEAEVCYSSAQGCVHRRPGLGLYVKCMWVLGKFFPSLVFDFLYISQRCPVIVFKGLTYCNHGQALSSEKPGDPSHAAGPSEEFYLRQQK